MFGGPSLSLVIVGIDLVGDGAAAAAAATAARRATVWLIT